MKLSFLSLLMFSLMMFSFAQAQTLKYGDVIHLQNGWRNFEGGFLDTRGYQKHFEKTGNHLCVSTATDKNRDGGSGTWLIVSATGKAFGTPVLVGDDIHLENAWNKFQGGFLDTRGYQKDFEITGNHLCVSTALVKNRDNGSGVWKIVMPGKANGTPVANNDAVHLKNGWNKFNGGFLDACGFQKELEKTGNFLCVSTSTAQNRDNGSGIWKLILAKM